MKYFDAEQVKAMGRRIKEERIKSGLTQKSVADELGITSEMIIRIENGKSGCKIDHLFVLCQLFQVSADYLLMGNKEEEDKKTSYLIDNIVNSLYGLDEFDLDRIYRMIQLMLEKKPEQASRI